MTAGTARLRVTRSAPACSACDATSWCRRGAQVMVLGSAGERPACLDCAATLTRRRPAEIEASVRWAEDPEGMWAAAQARLEARRAARAAQAGGAR